MKLKINLSIVVFALILSYSADIAFVKAQSAPSINIVNLQYSGTVKEKWDYPLCASDPSTCNPDRILSRVREASRTFTDPFNPVSTKEIMHNKETDELASKTCYTYWDYPGKEGSGGTDGCFKKGPLVSTGVQPVGVRNRIGSGQLSEYKKFGVNPETRQFDENIVVSSEVADFTDSSKSSLVLDPVLSDSPQERSITANTTYWIRVLPKVYYLTDPKKNTDPIWDIWNASEVQCRYIGNPAGKVARLNWIGNDCVVIVSAKGHSSTDVTPSTGYPYYEYSLGWGTAHAITSSAPSISGASTVSTVSSGIASKGAVKTVAKTPDYTDADMQEIVLTGTGFDTSEPIEILLSNVMGASSTVSTIEGNILTVRTYFKDNITTLLEAYSSDSTSLTFKVPRDLVIGYKIQVRNQNSEWSEGQSLATLLGIKRSVLIPTISTSTITVEPTVYYPVSVPVKVPMAPSSAVSTTVGTKISTTSNTTSIKTPVVSATSSSSIKLPVTSTTSSTTKNTTPVQTTLKLTMTAPKITANAIGHNSIQFNWTKSNLIDSSKNIVKSNIVYSLIQLTPEKKNIVSNTNSTLFIYTNLAPARNYCVAVVATDLISKTYATSTSVCASARIRSNYFLTDKSATVLHAIESLFGF